MSKRSDCAHQARQHEAEARALWLERLALCDTGHVAPTYGELAQDARLSARQADAEHLASQCWGAVDAADTDEADDVVTNAEAAQALAFD